MTSVIQHGRCLFNNGVVVAGCRCGCGIIMSCPGQCWIGNARRAHVFPCPRFVKYVGIRTIKEGKNRERKWEKAKEKRERGKEKQFVWDRFIYQMG